MTSETTSIQKALLTNNLAMLLYGVSAVLIGPTLPRMIVDLELSLGAAGLIGSMQNVGGFLGALLALIISDRISRPAATFISFALLGAALFAIGLSGSYLTLLITFLASGVCIRVLDVMLNAYTGELVGPRSGGAMSMLHTFFGVGAFAGPLVAGELMRTGTSWSVVFILTGAGYFLVLLVIAAFFRSVLHGVGKANTNDPEEPPADTADVASENPESRESAGPDTPDGDAVRLADTAVLGRMAILGVLLFFYAVHQIGIISWLPYFLESARGAGGNIASFGLSIYWIGIIAGRLLTSRIADRVGPSRILCGGSFVAAAAAGAAVIVPPVPLALFLFGLSGMASGATIPLAYSVGYRVAPGNAGRITALMSIIMLLGRVASPWIIGAAADTITITWAMLIPAAALIGSGVLATCFAATATAAPGSR